MKYLNPFKKFFKKKNPKNNKTISVDNSLPLKKNVTDSYLPTQINNDEYFNLIRNTKIIDFNKNELDAIYSILPELKKVDVKDSNNCSKYFYISNIKKAIEIEYWNKSEYYTFNLFLIALEDDYYIVKLSDEDAMNDEKSISYYKCDQIEELLSLLKLAKKWYDKIKYKNKINIDQDNFKKFIAK